MAYKSHIEKILDEAERRAARAVDTAGQEAEFHALMKVPKDTGELAMGIEWRHGGGKGLQGRLVSRDHKTIWHEYGTVHHSATPFLRPAAELAEDGFVADMRDIYPRG